MNTRSQYADSTISSMVLMVEPSKGAVSSHLLLAANKDQSTCIRMVDFDKTLKKWKVRLNTREDVFRIHKISSIAYTISSAIILGTGTIQLVQSPKTLFLEVPSSLVIPGYIFAISNAAMCFSSVQMALNHRRNNVPARNVLLGAAVSTLLSGF